MFLPPPHSPLFRPEAEKIGKREKRGLKRSEEGRGLGHKGQKSTTLQGDREEI